MENVALKDSSCTHWVKGTSFFRFIPSFADQTPAYCMVHGRFAANYPKLEFYTYPFLDMSPHFSFQPRKNLLILPQLIYSYYSYFSEEVLSVYESGDAGIAEIEQT